MKKLISSFLIFLFVFQMLLTPQCAMGNYPTIERDIHAMGGSTIADVVIVDGVTMVGLDSLSFYIGASPVISKGRPGMSRLNHSFSVDAGTNKAYVDGQVVAMPVSSFQQNGDIYVPLSFAVKSLGLMVYWRDQTKTIYIQDPANYQQALDLITNSLTAVKNKNGVTTTYENYTNISSDQIDRYFIKSVGTMETDMKKDIAKDKYTSTSYYGFYDSAQHEPVQTYVSKDPIDIWNGLEYITANGIYSANAKGTYDKQPFPPENISTMDMATKSVQTDLNLFLYSATISTDYIGSFRKEDQITILQAETDIGILLKAGFDIYLPEDSKTLHWGETYQTIQYDPQTFLPKNMELYLNANYQYGSGEYEKVHLSYSHQYVFDFSTDVQVNLPSGIE